MATNKNRRFLIPVTAFIMSVFLCGYGFDTHAAASVPDAVKTPDGTAAVSASSASGTKSGEQPKTRSSVRDRMRDMLDDEKDEAPSTKPSQTAKPAADANSIESIAALANLYAKAEREKKYCVVDVDDEHNPYDVAWDYGRDYDKYVSLVDDAGMWDILFNAEF